MSEKLDCNPSFWINEDMKQNSFQKRNRYRNYLTVGLLVFLAVLAVFRLIEDRQIAGALAGALFTIVFSTIFLFELRKPAPWTRFTVYGIGLFLVSSALPILILRIVNWGEPWADVSIFGIAATELHFISSRVYVVMMICFFVDSMIEQKKALRGPFEEGHRNDIRS